MRDVTRVGLVLLLLGTMSLFSPEDARSETLDGSCTVTRNCDYGPPISCSSPNGTCSSGPDNLGWVECDGNRTYCPVCSIPPKTPTCEQVEGSSCGITGATKSCRVGECGLSSCSCSGNPDWVWICAV